MSISTNSARYTSTAIWLHWLLGVALIGAFGVGVYMTDLPVSPQRIRIYNLHKAVGATILFFTLLRLLWRLTHTPPALPSSMSALQMRLSHLGHGLLYVLFFAVPLAGWAYSSAAGYPVSWFGIVQLPDWVSKNKELADVMKVVHKALAWGLALVVIGHIGAALKHQFMDKDNLLARMRP